MKPYMHLIAVVLLLSPPAFAKWSQNMPPAPAAVTIADSSSAMKLTGAGLAFGPDREAITPAEALKDAIEFAVEMINRDLRNGWSTFIYPKAVAREVVKRFRAAGWIVEVVERPGERSASVLFSWPESK